MTNGAAVMLTILGVLGFVACVAPQAFVPRAKVKRAHHFDNGAGSFWLATFQLVEYVLTFGAVLWLAREILR